MKRRRRKEAEDINHLKLSQHSPLSYFPNFEERINSVITKDKNYKHPSKKYGTCIGKEKEYKCDRKKSSVNPVMSLPFSLSCQVRMSFEQDELSVQLQKFKAPITQTCLFIPKHTYNVPTHRRRKFLQPFCVSRIKQTYTNTNKTSINIIR